LLTEEIIKRDTRPERRPGARSLGRRRGADLDMADRNGDGRPAVAITRG
jgi:hypothetical protein